MHGNLTGAYDIRHLDGPQSRRRHQQDADRIQSRLRRPAGLLRARAAGSAHRGRARPRSARRHHAQSGLGRRLSVPDRERRAARFRKLSGGDPARRRRGRARRAQVAPRSGARRGPALRHRLYRRGRAQRVQHGLHHDRADAGRAPQGRPEERRPGHRDGRDRSGRQRHGSCRFGAAGAGPSHRSFAGRGRRVRLDARRYQGQHRNRYGQGRLVDRVGQLRQPFRAGGRRHRQARRRAHRGNGWRASPPAS